MTAPTFVKCEECKRPIPRAAAVGLGEPPKFFHPIRCCDVELQRIRARVDKALADAGLRR